MSERLRRVRPFRFAVIGSALAALILSGCSDSVPPLPAPPAVRIPPTSTSIPDYSGVSIAPVLGSTSTTAVAVRGGGASITGLVRLNGAPIPGAMVRVDRFVNDKSAGFDLVTDADGRYRADGLLGGRYRVRAFRAPDATTDTPQIFFLGVRDAKNLDLNLKTFAGNSGTTFNIAPNPPLVGQLANFVVAMTTEQVDASGVARTIGIPGVVLRLDTDGGRSLVSSNITVTNESGRASWQLMCNSTENQGMTLTYADGRTQRIEAAGCQVPPSTTTTVPGATDGSVTTTTR